MHLKIIDIYCVTITNYMKRLRCFRISTNIIFYARVYLVSDYRCFRDVEKLSETMHILTGIRFVWAERR